MRKPWIFAGWILLILMVGCGRGEPSLYDEATNQQVTFHGIGIQVPEQWEQPEGGEDNDTLSFAQWGETDQTVVSTLSLVFEENADLGQALEELDLSKGISEEEGPSWKGYQERDTEVAGLSAVVAEYERLVSDQTFQVRIIILETEEGVVIIQFATSTASGMADFEKVQTSITWMGGTV